MQNTGKGTRSHTRSHGSFKPAVISFIAHWIMRLLGLTLRFRLDDVSGNFHFDDRLVCIYAFWHNRIGIMTLAYWRYFRRTRIATLVSASRDGEILARTVQRFGLHPVRGSTSRRGAQSLLEMVRLVGDGYSAVITPDGPRGPAEVMQPGIISLAKVTGAPIITVSCTPSRFIQIKSWDRFMIPMPFARCDVRIGRPIAVPRDADEKTLERLRLQLQDELKQLA